MTSPDPPTDPANRSRIAAIAAERRRNLGPEPSIDTLRAYLAGELPAQEADRVQEHLATDPELADLLLDLHDFEAAEPEVPSLSEADLDERLSRFRERLGGTEPVDAPAGAGDPASEAAESAAPEGGARIRPFHRPADAPSGTATELPRLRAYGPARLLIAALLLVAVGVGGWLVGRLTTEQAAPAVVAELAPEGSFRTRSGDLPRIEIPAWAGRMVLVLPVLDPAAGTYARYRLEIRSLTGQGAPAGAGPVLSTQTEPAGGDLFTQILPTERFAPGAYQATIYGVDDGRETPLESYRFRISRTEGTASGSAPER